MDEIGVEGKDEEGEGTEEERKGSQIGVHPTRRNFSVVVVSTPIL